MATKEMLLGMIRAGQTGNDILNILDVIAQEYQDVDLDDEDEVEYEDVESSSHEFVTSADSL